MVLQNLALALIIKILTVVHTTQTDRILDNSNHHIFFPNGKTIYLGSRANFIAMGLPLGGG